MEIKVDKNCIGYPQNDAKVSDTKDARIKKVDLIKKNGDEDLFDLGLKIAHVRENIKLDDPTKYCGSEDNCTGCGCNTCCSSC